MPDDFHRDYVEALVTHVGDDVDLDQHLTLDEVFEAGWEAGCNFGRSGGDGLEMEEARDDYFRSMRATIQRRLGLTNE